MVALIWKRFYISSTDNLNPSIKDKETETQRNWVCRQSSNKILSFRAKTRTQVLWLQSSAFLLKPLHLIIVN